MERNRDGKISGGGLTYLTVTIQNRRSQETIREKDALTVAFAGNGAIVLR